MKTFCFSLAIISLAIPTQALPPHPGKHDRTTPAPNSIIVDVTGSSPRSVLNITSAVKLLSTNTTAPQTIFVYPGTYTEQVYIPSLASPLTIQGYTKDTQSYLSNTATLTFNLSRQVPGLANNDATATLRLWTSNVKIYNLNIANTFGAAVTSGQALALSAQNTDQGFYGCRFEGWQDTIYANEGRQIYAGSYISGAVDFIFGLRARAWLENVDIETLGPGFITANGRDAANNTSIYVFNNAKIGGSSGRNSTFLDRPWRQYSRVVWQRSEIGDVVNPEGWSRWDAVQSVENVEYGEYKNRGPGANIDQRVSWSEQLRKEIRIDDVLGKGYEKETWVDKEFL